ncbi:hypothetical protein [Actinophytocola gossypii]|uniref:Uncharacterized protein n=1 Tax=Actinophytocola gossypii TaxID=2812003 RepID=A0ABT2J8C4_9PSEU|nr:hypothetical protein [Actinophytocola gossypii]MCT2584108.1 hypothetical protein [Actinophytocola gossypii]
MGRHANGEQAAPAFGDWRARMALRGGPVTHMIARAGWGVFAVLCAVLMVGVAVLYAANPGENGADNSTGANFIGGMIAFVPIGAAIGALLGLPAQFAVRSWLRTPTELERRAARAAEEHATRFVADGLRASGWWAGAYERCAKSVTAFHAVVGTLRHGAGQDWFTGIGDTLDLELAEALRLARLGEGLAPDVSNGARLTGAALEAADLLRAAERSFAETTERAASIALDLRDETDFVRVRAQLEMLAAQAPHLRAEG